MYIIAWEYQVKKEKLDEFIKIYSAHGDWSELFRNAPGYLGTELLHDENDPKRYLTIDRWDSKGSFEAFLSRWGKEYGELDKLCEGLTEDERLLGRFMQG
ncbi:MAG: antibiotic biosynthesis monooxygenase [Chloroflexi bacterium CFX2]|nr:antibiotic biosynthesis monooxygenase [Chloroflexi bacterium CFX2]